MPVRARYQMQVGISSTSAEEKDLGNANYQQVTDGFNEGGTMKLTLVASAIDVPVALDNIATVGLIAIKTNAKDPTQPAGEIKIRFNTITNEQRSIIPMPGQPEGHLLMTTGNLTSLFATNLAGVDMEMTITIAGS